MLDVKRTSERLMVVRVIVGRFACVQVNGGKRGVTGHVGRCSFGKRHVEDEMILEFADALNLAVLNMQFKKREEIVHI